MTETLEHTARRIAKRGREALLARLRPAFQEAAGAHSDVLSLDEDQLNEMVERAADRADGLQWRRALAGVAAEELGIGLGEALSHPAVARAQAIVGAPSYEESLAALGAAPPAQPAAPATATGEDEREEREDEDEDPEDERDDKANASNDGSPAAEATATAQDAEPRTDDQPAVPAPEATEDVLTLRLAAVHLGGIANLEPAEPGIELILSEAGLDISRGADELLGRLRWPEIRSLDVPTPKGLRRRRHAAGAHLVIRTRHGDATFEIPKSSAEELQNQLKPLLERHASQ